MRGVALFLYLLRPIALNRFLFVRFHSHDQHLLPKGVLLLHQQFVFLKEIVDGTLKLLLANSIMIQRLFQLLLELLVHVAVLIQHTDLTI